MTILNSADYPAIRAAIHVSLDELKLSNTVVDASGVSADAEREILSRGIVYADLSAEQQVNAKRAAVLLAAAYLAPATTGVVVTSLSNQRQGVSYSRPAFDGDAMAASLRARADDILAELLSEEVPETIARQRPTMFAVARARRLPC